MSDKKVWPWWAWLLTAVGIVIIAGAAWWLLANRHVVNMDELSKDNQYHYRNEDLGFSLNLPEQFQYYQTERTNSADYQEIKFYVPTNDPAYVYEAFPSYAKPIVIRIYQAAAYNKLSKDDENKRDFQTVKTKGDKIYLIWFWDRQPKDWQNKWTEEMREAIKQSVK